jgi:hypothetical protein
LVTHPKIAPGQARLTSKFFAGGLQKKKVYLGGMSILSILLSLEPGCHRVSVRLIMVVGSRSDDGETPVGESGGALGS